MNMDFTEISIKVLLEFLIILFFLHCLAPKKGCFHAFVLQLQHNASIYWYLRAKCAARN